LSRAHTQVPRFLCSGGRRSKKGHDIPDVKEKAREATKAAENARAEATERGQESSPLRPQDRP